MAMTLRAVASILDQSAHMEMAQAETRPDYAGVVVNMQKARLYRDMASAVRLALTEAPTLPVVATVQSRRRRTTRAPKATRVTKPKTLGALAFWQSHGEAVAAIRARYGDAWKIKAPIGETELVTLASGLRSYTTERGTKLKWGGGHRIPAAHYWPGNTLPVGVAVVADYPRHDAKVVVLHNASWYKARGYVWNCGEWRQEVEVRMEAARAEQLAINRAAALERAALTYGPQPSSDAEYDLAEAAD